MGSGYQALTLTSNGGLLRSLKMEVHVLYSGKRYTCKAVWDTGATGTCISKRVIDAMGLVPIGFTSVNTANGLKEDAGQFIINIAFPNSVTITDLRATEFSGGGDIDMLIGMDVICMGDMSITNANGLTVFSYRIPSDWAHIDYVEAAKSSKYGKIVKSQLKKNQK